MGILVARIQAAKDYADLHVMLCDGQQEGYLRMWLMGTLVACGQAAKDYRTDADLHAACEPDAKQLCSNVNPGEGRIQDCLRDKAVSVSWECQEELFRQVPSDVLM